MRENKKNSNVKKMGLVKSKWKLAFLSIFKLGILLELCM